MDARDIITFMKATPPYRELLRDTTAARIGRYQYVSLNSDDPDTLEVFQSMQKQLADKVDDNVRFLHGVYAEDPIEEDTEGRTLAGAIGLTMLSRKVNFRMTSTAVGPVVYIPEPKEGDVDAMKAVLKLFKDKPTRFILVIGDMGEEKDTQEVFYSFIKESEKSSDAIELQEESRDRNKCITEEHIVDLKILLEASHSYEDVLQAIEKAGM